MKAKDLAFGVEIECYLPNGTIEQVGGYHHGLQVEWLPDGWNAQGDGSLCQCPQGFRPAEIVSPILKGEDGLAQAWYAAEAIKELGGIVNDTCGLHVHLDARNLTRSQVAAITEAFRTYEKAFYGMSGGKAARRWNNHYCQNSSNWMGGRYQSLNLTNWLDTTRTTKRTLEIRCFAGTLDEPLLTSIIYLAVGLVVGVLNGHCKGTGERMADPVAAAKKLIGSTVVHKDCRIYEDCTVNEVACIAIRQTRKARLPEPARS